MKPLDLHGKSWGMLRVIGRKGSGADGAIWWECLCDCGNKKAFRGADIKRELIKSCGCWRHKWSGFRFPHSPNGPRKTAIRAVYL